ncbi:MAG: hypothetical protein Tsb0034_13810 [Ekhidna sp.]
MKRKLLTGAMVINTLLMIAFTLYLMKLPWLAGDEKFLIWSTSALKFADREAPPSEDFALINTSYDLQLIDRYDEFGFPVGNQVITDRAKLAQLLEVINSGESRPKFIICDIHFVDSTESDEALRQQLLADNVIISSHLDADLNFENQLFEEANHGISDYVIGSVFDGVYKYQLIYRDSLKLLPLKVHEVLSGTSAKRVGPFVRLDDGWTMNNFIMNYRVLQKDIEDFEAGFNPVNLGELLFLDDQDIRDYTADKIVIIGDFFEQDMHETIFEITAGPLILLNAYLTIRDGETSVNIIFFLLLFAVFAYLSFMVFTEGDVIEKKIRQIAKTKATRYMAGFTSYFVILTILSITTFFLFNIHLNVFFIALAFYLEDRLVGLFVYKS